MKQGWMVGFAVIGVAALTAVVVSLSQGIPTPEDAYAPVDTVAGHVIYLEACAKCHGATGEGTALAPSLKGRKIQSGLVRSRVRMGTGRMPKFPNLSGEALENLAEFVHTL